MQGTTIAVPVQSTADALRASLAGAVNTFLSAIPRLFGFALVLIIGWVISSLLARGVEALLHALKFNDLARRSGFSDFVQNMGVRDDSVGVIATIVKWFVRLITLVVAFDMLGLPAVSSVLQQLLLWLPNLVVALVVLVVGGLAANALSRLVRGATAQAGFSNPDLLATVTKVAVWGFTFVVAINQLGIATTLINTLMIGIVGAFSIAFGLAFGLGGRDRAAQILDQIGRQASRAGSGLERAVRAGARSVQNEVRQVPTTRTDGSWVDRSKADRRRVDRPGLNDRRVGNGSGT
jgi:Mechanosensitive ion channel, conserved TM helix